MTDLDRLDALVAAATPEEIENFRRTRDWYHGGKGDGVAHGHSDQRLPQFVPLSDGGVIGCE